MNMLSWNVAKSLVAGTGRALVVLITVPVWIVVIPFTGICEFVSFTAKFTAGTSRAKRRKPVESRYVESDSCDRELRYVMSSIFLRDCLTRLTPGDDEELVAVSGVQVGDIRVPCLLFPLDYDFASPAGVSANLQSSHARLREMSDHGHCLQCMLHSHPGLGREAVNQSPTDVATQERFERVGYQVISGIFSRDGHVKFFSNTLPFRVDVFGNGVRRIERNVFKIESIHDRAMQDHSAGGSPGGNGVGPAGKGVGVGPGRV